MIRAVAKSERVTIDQAAIAALVAVSDSIGPGVATMADALDVMLPPLDFEFLVPDPADRPAVRRAYRALVKSMPPEARRQAAASREAAEIAADNLKTISRAEAVTCLAARYGQRDAYLVAAGPGEVYSAAARLAPLGEGTAYLDRGDDTVMTVTGLALDVMTDVMDAAPQPVAAVWVIPKTVPAARVGTALGGDIPPDGSRDLVMITTHDGTQMAYPVLLVDAIGQVDPGAADDIRRGERDLVLSKLDPGTRALVDQADAATAHGAGILAAMAERGGGSFTHQLPPPLVREIAERFARNAAAGQVSLCPHLSPAAPQPAFWAPWNPGRINCVHCNAEAGERIKGTDEDQRCDNCSRLSGRIHNGAGLLPAVVADLPGIVAASGPVIVIFGLCPACHTEAFPERATAS